MGHLSDLTSQKSIALDEVQSAIDRINSSMQERSCGNKNDFMMDIYRSELARLKALKISISQRYLAAVLAASALYYAANAGCAVVMVDPRTP